MGRKATESRIFSFYLPNATRENIKNITHMTLAEFVRQAVYEKLSREYEKERRFHDPNS